MFNVLGSEAFFDSSLGASASLFNLKTDFFDAREYSVRGWLKWSEPKIQDAGEGSVTPEWYSVFRLTINNPNKEENGDHRRPGDRTLALFLN